MQLFLAVIDPCGFDQFATTHQGWPSEPCGWHQRHRPRHRAIRLERPRQRRRDQMRCWQLFVILGW